MRTQIALARAADVGLNVKFLGGLLRGENSTNRRLAEELVTDFHVFQRPRHGARLNGSVRKRVDNRDKPPMAGDHARLARLIDPLNGTGGVLIQFTHRVHVNLIDTSGKFMLGAHP